jgi:hypothetical protein
MSKSGKKTLIEYFLRVEVSAARWDRLSDAEIEALAVEIEETVTPLLEQLRAAIEAKLGERGVSAVAGEE